MTRRLLAFTWKEVREHFLVVFLLAITLPFGWGIFALSALGSPTTVTYLEAHASFCRFILPLAGLALGNRLVVHELHGRTMRFIESLPTPRYEQLIVKWVMGLVVLVAIAVGELFASEVMALTREPFDGWFLFLLLSRTLAYVFFGWCLFFTMGFFGRIRVLIYVVMLVGLLVIASTTQLELMHFGPFAMVAPEMTTDRVNFPGAEIAVSVGLGLAFLAIGAALVSIRDGSVQERLAQPMSQRDRAMFGISFIGLLSIWGAFEHEAEPLPYEMVGHVVYASTLPIAIGFGDPQVEPDARAVMAELEPTIASFREAMHVERLPQMRVVLRRSLDRHTFEQVTLSHGDGMLVRANFLSGASGDAAVDRSAISAAVLEGMLDAYTRRRARFEPRRWWRDGLSTYWAYDRGRLPAVRLAQAAWATRTRGPDVARIDHFDRVREELGDEMAASLAATGVMALEHARPGAVVQAIPVTFAPSPPEDIRATLADWMHPVRAQIAGATGVDAAAHTQAWNETLAAIRARPDVREVLARLPAASATVTVERDASGILSVVTRLESTPGTEGLTLSVRHTSIGPFDTVVEDSALPRESVRVPPDGHAEVRLTGRYAAGDRVLVRVDLEGTVLLAPMRLAATRLELTP
ncbi:MAG: ABC transporter permease subunit [Sandaracinus sp.]